MLRWYEWSADGPEFELLCHVEDMGKARELARQADMDVLPQKDRLLQLQHDAERARANYHHWIRLLRASGGRCVRSPRRSG